MGASSDEDRATHEPSPEGVSALRVGVPLREEFCARFKAHMLNMAGQPNFDDGYPIADYADDAAPTYFDDMGQQGYSPEECADADMSYWGED